jgi:hypothetical protein
LFAHAHILLLDSSPENTKYILMEQKVYRRRKECEIQRKPLGRRGLMKQEKQLNRQPEVVRPQNMVAPQNIAETDRGNRRF